MTEDFDDDDQTEYRVIWAVDLRAANPQEAAVKAREYQLKPNGIHTLFNVYLRSNLKGKATLVETDEKLEQAHVH